MNALLPVMFFSITVPEMGEYRVTRSAICFFSASVFTCASVSPQRNSFSRVDWAIAPARPSGLPCRAMSNSCWAAISAGL